MPVPSGLGTVIPESVHRDLEDLYETLGGSGGNGHGGDGMLKHSRETLQAVDELDDHVMAYYDQTRRQVERTMDWLQKFRGRGSMYSGVPESCRVEPVAWWSWWMWWRGTRVTTREDVVVGRLDEWRELLRGRQGDMDAARHHPSGGRADQLNRVVEGSCHYAKAAREYVGLQIDTGVVDRIEGSERAGEDGKGEGKHRVGGSNSIGDDAGTNAGRISEAATGLQAVCVATRWSKERHEELVGQTVKETKLLGRAASDVDYLRDKVRRTYSRDEAEVGAAGNGKAQGWCEREDELVEEVEAEMGALVARYLETLGGCFGRAYD
ncbi:LOW QUALITY PROTEIN: hypothetical protein ColTof4_13556 [Colletotrichum tofieldiae]|nr:LOW QUALITY PROTEIN: hypothetical protein ColTof4_13556 [Colletotrichum tofieldiae]